MNNLFTQYVCIIHISFSERFAVGKNETFTNNLYRSCLTPKPGPFGGSVREVRPPAGSQEKRPLL